MKLSLIHCGDGIQPPLGIAYVASYVRHFGDHDVQIIDFGAGDSLEDIKSPDFVGVTATTPWFVKAKETASWVKERFPDVPIVLGGVHITAMPDSLSDSPFDIGVLGEGEQTMLDILECKPLGEILGITYKGKDGKQLTNDSRPLIEDVNTIPFPARDLLRMKEYYLKPKQVIRGILKRSTQIMSSRGCPYDCVFCGSCIMWNRKVRSYSPEYIIAELKELIEMYKTEAVFFQDDMLTLDKNRLGEVCNLMKEEGISDKIIWSCQLRANLVNRETIELIKGAGCVQAEFGFESGSDKTLKYLKGGNVTVEQNRQAVQLCNEAGIRVLGNFLVGAPYETKEDIEETVQFIRDNRMDFAHVHMLTPFPGTALWKFARDNPKAYEWERYQTNDVHENIIVSQELSCEELEGIYSEIVEEVDELNYGGEQYQLSSLLDPSVIKRAAMSPGRTLKRLKQLIRRKLSKKD